MELDVINRKDINKFVVDFVFNNQEIPPISADDLKNLQYVTNNEDTVIRAILAQYLKAKMPGYISEIILNEDREEDIGKTLSNKPYLEPVAANDVSEEWARNKIANGGQLFTFNPDKVSDDLKDTLTKVGFYLYFKTSDRIDEEIDKKQKIDTNNNKNKEKSNCQTENEKTRASKDYKPKVMLDLLKVNPDYNPFGKVLAAADKWHQETNARLEQIEKDAEFKRAVEAGTTKVMDFEDGCYAVRLTTLEALDFESKVMRHCVGDGEYDENVKNGKTRIYSIRDHNGEPHVTFEVRQNKEGKWAVCQCKGKQNEAPVAKYRPAVTLFMNKMGFEIEQDKKNLGLIKQDGKYYDIWHLPKGFVIEGDLDLSGMGLTELPDLSDVIIKGNFNCSGNKLTTLKGAPKEVWGKCRVCNNPIKSFEDVPIYQRGKRYNLYDLPKGFVIEGDLDLSGMGLTELPDLSDVIVRGSFNCSDNKLTTFTGAPAVVGGKCSICHNPIKYFEDIPIYQRGKRYNLYDLPRGFVIEGDLDLSGMGLTELPNLSDVIVKGNFNISDNKLTSLKGSPKKVRGGFVCNYNPLTNLEGYLIYQDGKCYDICHLPKDFIIKGNLDLSHMALTELPDLSDVTVNGDFNCKRNRLTTFKGAPQKVGGDIYYSGNPLCNDESVVSEYLASAVTVNGDFNCKRNRLKTFKGALKKVGGDIYYSGNPLCNDGSVVSEYLASAKIKSRSVLEKMMRVVVNKIRRARNG